MSAANSEVNTTGIINSVETEAIVQISFHNSASINTPGPDQQPTHDQNSIYHKHLEQPPNHDNDKDDMIKPPKRLDPEPGPNDSIDLEAQNIPDATIAGMSIAIHKFVSPLCTTSNHVFGPLFFFSFDI